MKNTRRSPRAVWHDYSSAGAYFLTICTKDRQHYFGAVVAWKMILNVLGEYVYAEIMRLSERSQVRVDTFIVMPNHVHMVLVLDESVSSVGTVGADYQSASLLIDKNISDEGGLLNRPYAGLSIPSIIKLWKWNISKFAKRNDIVFGWQRSYHDHIIRNSWEYERIAYYITTNPENWHKDKFSE